MDYALIFGFLVLIGIQAAMLPLSMAFILLSGRAALPASPKDFASRLIGESRVLQHKDTSQRRGSRFECIIFLRMSATSWRLLVSLWLVIVISAIAFVVLSDKPVFDDIPNLRDVTRYAKDGILSNDDRK